MFVPMKMTFICGQSSWKTRMCRPCMTLIRTNHMFVPMMAALNVTFASEMASSNAILLKDTP